MTSMINSTTRPSLHQTSHTDGCLVDNDEFAGIAVAVAVPEGPGVVILDHEKQRITGTEDDERSKYTIPRRAAKHSMDAGRSAYKPLPEDNIVYMPVRDCDAMQPRELCRSVRNGIHVGIESIATLSHFHTGRSWVHLFLFPTSSPSNNNAPLFVAACFSILDRSPRTQYSE